MRNSPDLGRRILARAGSVGNRYGSERMSLDEGLTMSEMLQTDLSKPEDSPLIPLEEEV